jgi:hypothetical protein
VVQLQTFLKVAASWLRHAGTYEFVEDTTPDGRRFRMLADIDKFTLASQA